MRPVRTEHIAGHRNSANPRIIPNDPRRLRKLTHHHDTVEQLADSSGQRGRRGDEIDRPSGTRGKGGTGGARGVRAAPTL